ncbi:hypothetical protein B9479_003769 [Cryptococcus floricola]|uniref:Uncharacterized protein n=1 Tax=Cryptococcus floricola TaxID=2591691 RepID=A0A5D3AVQ5_9TREE|nr:hypothetical protein B9479_003769 [Cryptococcus floricola]
MPLIKKRQPRDGASFFHFDLASLRPRSRSSRTGTATPSPNPSPAPTPTSPAHSFSPFSNNANAKGSRGSGSRGHKSLNGMPSIQHVMDAYDIPAHPAPSSAELYKECEGRGKRGTMKLPVMMPPPSGSSYGYGYGYGGEGRKRDSWEMEWEVDEWARGPRVVVGGGSSTQPSTPDVPSFHDNRQRTQSMNPPVRLRPPPPEPPASAPPAPAHPREGWEGEEDALVMLSRLSGRVEGDGWGYGSKNAGGTAKRASHAYTYIPPPSRPPPPAREQSVRSWREARKSRTPIPPPPTSAPSQPPPAAPSRPPPSRAETQETKARSPHGPYSLAGHYIPPAPPPRGLPPQPPGAQGQVDRVVTTTITAGHSSSVVGTRYSTGPPIPRRSSARPSYPSSKPAFPAYLGDRSYGSFPANNSSTSLLDPSQPPPDYPYPSSSSSLKPRGLTVQDMFRARSSTASSGTPSVSAGAGGGVREWVKVDRRMESDDEREGKMEVINVPSENAPRSHGGGRGASASISPKSGTVGLPSEWSGSTRMKTPRDEHSMGFSALDENYLSQSLAKAQSSTSPPPPSAMHTRHTKTKPRANTSSSSFSSSHSASFSLSPSASAGPPTTTRHIPRKASSSARSVSSSNSSTSVVSGAVAAPGSRGGQVSGMDAVGGLPDFGALGSVVKGLRGRLGQKKGGEKVASPGSPGGTLYSPPNSQQSSQASLPSPYPHPQAQSQVHGQIQVQVDSQEGIARPWADRLAPAPLSPVKQQKEEVYIIPPSERSKIGEEGRSGSRSGRMEKMFGRGSSASASSASAPALVSAPAPVSGGREKEGYESTATASVSVAASDSTSECSLFFIPKPSSSSSSSAPAPSIQGQGQGQGQGAKLEGVKEEYRSEKEANAARHQSVHLMQEQRARNVFASLASPTPAPATTSNANANGSTSDKTAHPPSSFSPVNVNTSGDSLGLNGLNELVRPTALNGYTTQEWEEDEWANENAREQEEKERERKGLMPPPRPRTRGQGSISEEGAPAFSAFGAGAGSVPQSSAQAFLRSPPITPLPSQPSHAQTHPALPMTPATTPTTTISSSAAAAPDKRKKEGGEEKRLRRKPSGVGRAVGLEVELGGGAGEGGGKGSVRRKGSVSAGAGGSGPYPTPTTPNALAAFRSAISPSPSQSIPSTIPKAAPAPAPTPAPAPAPAPTTKPLPADPTPTRRPSSPSVLSTTPTSGSGSSADFIKEREEKERQRRALMDMWLDAKPIRGQKGSGTGTAPSAFGAGSGAGGGAGRKVSGGAGGGRPGTSTGQTSTSTSGEKQPLGCFRRASLDGRRLSGV